jgi:glutamate--cysteine ligase
MDDGVRTKQDLIRYFESGAKPRPAWRVGTEYEKIAVSARDGRALPYSGVGGVEHLLRLLVERFGYEPEEEDGRILGLKGARAMISIEPGAQIELSGEQCETIHCANEEFTEHIKQLIEVGSEFDVALLGLGMQPISRLDEIELIPKARYHIIRDLRQFPRQRWRPQRLSYFPRPCLDRYRPGPMRHARVRF